MIKIEPDYRTVDELKEEWGCTTSDIFNWAYQCLLKIWETECLRMQEAGEPISKQQANEIFHTLTLEGLELFEYLEGDFDPNAYEYHVSIDHAITNKEIERFEQIYKEPESEEERKARKLKRKETEEKERAEWQENASQPKTVALEMAAVGHPYHSPTFSAAIHCWNSLYKNIPRETPKPKRGYIYKTEKWLKENYSKKNNLSGKNIKRISTLINPDPKGGGVPSKSNYQEDPNANKTHIEITEGHPFASEKLIAATRCYKDFYENKTAHTHLKRKDKQNEKLLKWLEHNYPNLSDTAKKGIISVINPNPTGR